VLGHPAVPYVLPFVVFLAFLAAAPYLAWPPVVLLTVWPAATGAAIWAFSRRLLSFRFVSFFPSVLVGIGVFAVWIAPDLIVAGWRQHWLFQNSLTGELKTALGPGVYSDPLVLVLRTLRAVVIVPIVEELFWRGWLMRWIINPRFETVPLGAYTAFSFWAVAVLFALEHGPYWEVGFIAGAIYNGWIVRTKSLPDVILAHAVTNACLCLFVVLTGRWEYWL
jgi:uncharacterized protein